MATLTELLSQLTYGDRAAIDVPNNKIAGPIKGTIPNNYGVIVGGINTKGLLERRTINFSDTLENAWKHLAEKNTSDTWEIATLETFTAIHSIYVSCGL